LSKKSLQTSLDTVPQGLSRFLAGSGLIFRAQQEICGACRFDSLIIFVYLLADIWMSLISPKYMVINAMLFLNQKFCDLYPQNFWYSHCRPLILRSGP